MTEIRQAILRNSGPQWRKVTMVVFKAHAELELPDNKASYDIVAKELTQLVEAGELEAAGDLSNWRRSEVRLPVA